MAGSFIIASVLAICHFAGPRVLRMAAGAGVGLGSFGGGLATAYVFLNLMPEIENTHAVLGERVHLIILAGFLLFFAVDRLQRERWRRALRLAFAALYNALLIYTIGEIMERTVSAIALSTLALGLHLMFADRGLEEHLGQRLWRLGRPLVVASLFVGGAASEITESELVGDLSLLLLTGFMLYSVFAEELPDRNHVRFGWFLGGAVTLSLLDVAAGSG